MNWETVSMCKDFGGLGIPNLRDLNICLLSSWLKRYQVDDEKLWKQLIDSCGLPKQLKWDLLDG